MVSSVDMWLSVTQVNHKEELTCFSWLKVIKSPFDQRWAAKPRSVLFSLQQHQTMRRCVIYTYIGIQKKNIVSWTYVSLPGRNIPQLPPIVFYGAGVIFSVQNKLHSFSESISKCFRLEVSYFTLFIPRDPAKHCMCSHQADLLRAILPANTQYIVWRFKEAPKTKRALQIKTNTFLLFFTISFRARLKKERDIGSTLYCVSWGLHSPTQKRSLRRFVSFNCPLCSNTMYK